MGMCRIDDIAGGGSGWEVGRGWIEVVGGDWSR